MVKKLRHDGSLRDVLAGSTGLVKELDKKMKIAGDPDASKIWGKLAEKATNILG